MLHAHTVALAAGACVVTACVATACSGTSTPAAGPTAAGPTATGRPSVTASSPTPTLPPGTRELSSVEGATLPAGRYTRSDFTPRLSFQIGKGWHVGHDINGFFDVQRRPNTPDVIAVQFALPFNTPTPAAAIHRLQRSHGLRTTDRGATTLGGRPAHEVLVDSRNPHLAPAKYTGIFEVSAGELYIGSGRRLLIDFIQVKDGALAVLVGGSVRSWAATMRAAKPVLRSIRFI